MLTRPCFSPGGRPGTRRRCRLCCFVCVAGTACASLFWLEFLWSKDKGTTTLGISEKRKVQPECSRPSGVFVASRCGLPGGSPTTLWSFPHQPRCADDVAVGTLAGCGWLVVAPASGWQCLPVWTGSPGARQGNPERQWKATTTQCPQGSPCPREDGSYPCILLKPLY